MLRNNVKYLRAHARARQVCLNFISKYRRIALPTSVKLINRAKQDHAKRKDGFPINAVRVGKTRHGKREALTTC